MRHQSELTVSKVKEHDNLSLNAPYEPVLVKLVVGSNAISAGEIVKLDSTFSTMQNSDMNMMVSNVTSIRPVQSVSEVSTVCKLPLQTSSSIPSVTSSSVVNNVSN